MKSLNKTFTEVISSEMVPAARIVVYALQPQSEELAVDTLSFSVARPGETTVSLSRGL